MELTNIHSAKTHLSKLVDRVFSGEEIIICKSGRPMAKLVKYIAQTQMRTPGQWKGQMRMSSDFDVLPSSLMAAFRGDDETSA